MSKKKKRSKKEERELAKKARPDADFESLAGTDDPPNDNTVLGGVDDSDDINIPSPDDRPAKALQNCCENEVLLPPHIFSRVETSPTKKPRLSFYTNPDCSGDPLVSIKIKRRQAKLLNTILF